MAVILFIFYGSLKIFSIRRTFHSRLLLCFHAAEGAVLVPIFEKFQYLYTSAVRVPDFVRIWDSDSTSIRDGSTDKSENAIVCLHII